MGPFLRLQFKRCLVKIHHGKEKALEHRCDYITQLNWDTTGDFLLISHINLNRKKLGLFRFHKHASFSNFSLILLGDLSSAGALLLSAYAVSFPRGIVGKDKDVYLINKPCQTSDANYTAPNVLEFVLYLKNRDLFIDNQNRLIAWKFSKDGSVDVYKLT